jgi:hypothetical protein
VHGNGIGPAQFGQDRSGDRIGLDRPAGLPYRCHVVDVHPEFHHEKTSLCIVLNRGPTPQTEGVTHTVTISHAPQKTKGCV